MERDIPAGDERGLGSVYSRLLLANLSFLRSARSLGQVRFIAKARLPYPDLGHGSKHFMSLYSLTLLNSTFTPGPIVEDRVMRLR